MKNILLIISCIIYVGVVGLELIPFFNVSLVLYAIPVVLVFINMFLKLRKVKNKDDRNRVKKLNFFIMFGMYIGYLILLLFFSSSYRINRFDNVPLFSKAHFELYSNLVPFRTISSYVNRLINGSINFNIVLVNLFGNLIAFSPFGFFIPYLFKDKFNLLKFTFFMMFIVFIVELIQFITFVGAADVDDIILNVFGAVVVFLVARVRFVQNILDRF